MFVDLVGNPSPRINITNLYASNIQVIFIYKIELPTNEITSPRTNEFTEYTSFHSLCSVFVIFLQIAELVINIHTYVILVNEDIT